MVGESARKAIQKLSEGIGDIEELYQQGLLEGGAPELMEALGKVARLLPELKQKLFSIKHSITVPCILREISISNPVFQNSDFPVLSEYPDLKFFIMDRDVDTRTYLETNCLLVEISRMEKDSANLPSDKTISAAEAALHAYFIDENSMITFFSGVYAQMGLRFAAPQKIAAPVKKEQEIPQIKGFAMSTPVGTVALKGVTETSAAEIQIGLKDDLYFVVLPEPYEPLDFEDVLKVMGEERASYLLALNELPGYRVINGSRFTSRANIRYSAIVVESAPLFNAIGADYTDFFEALKKSPEKGLLEIVTDETPAWGEGLLYVQFLGKYKDSGYYLFLYAQESAGETE